jgi:hypothetical protein
LSSTGDIFKTQNRKDPPIFAERSGTAGVMGYIIKDPHTCVLIYLREVRMKWKSSGVM